MFTAIRQWAQSRPLAVVAFAVLLCALTVVRVGTSEASPVTTTDRSDSALPGSDGASGSSPESASGDEQNTPSGSATNGSDETDASNEDESGDETTDGGSDTTPLEGSSAGDSSTTDETGGGAGAGTYDFPTGASVQPSGPWQSNFFAELPRRWGVDEIYVQDAPPYGLNVIFVDDERPEVGDTVATVTYIGYACTGTWTLESRTSSTVVLHEDVDVDPDADAARQCAPEATVELERRSAGRIQYDATGSTGAAEVDYSVVPARGTLTPTG